MTKMQITRRRALGALATIGAGSAAAGAGTFALFSDEETSDGNSLTAGTLDLQTGNSSTISFTASDVKPGQSGSSSLDLQKAGSIAGDLTVEVTSVSSTENNNPDSETDTTGDGELDDQLDLNIWLGTSSGTDTTFDSTADPVLNSDGTTGSSENYEPAVNYDATSWGDVITGFSGPVSFNVDWQFPDDGATNNAAQGDDLTVDFTFTLTQQ
ncbi:TasA family protein [Haloarculaceae archaeon H-GB2-1]|nr:TasA family protein [Haloarculaceae archaeon H-GB1-1]MEA5407897.1 TasA family protein [Haloarculaceae archaeon H-GB2-1]